MSLNRITIIGYVGKNPETRYTQNNEQVTSISVATTDKTVQNDDIPNDDIPF